MLILQASALVIVAVVVLVGEGAGEGVRGVRLLPEIQRRQRVFVEMKIPETKRAMHTPLQEVPQWACSLTV